MRSKDKIPEDLTDDQRKALDGYFNDPERFLVGVSLERSAENFREINALRSLDPDRAAEREALWFGMMHYAKPSPQETDDK